MTSNQTPTCRLLLAAVGDGDVNAVLAHRGTIDWPAFMDAIRADHFDHVSEIFNAACYSSDNLGIRSASVALMRLALEDGCSEFFETRDCDDGGTSFVQPILQFIENDFDEALKIFLDAGFDAEAVYGIDGLSAIDVAKEQSKPHMVHLMKTHVAHRAANKALAEIKGEIKGPAP